MVNGNYNVKMKTEKNYSKKQKRITTNQKI